MLINQWKLPRHIGYCSFALRTANYGPYALWSALKLRQTAIAYGFFPSPFNEEIIFDMSLNIVHWRRTYNYTPKTFNALVQSIFKRMEARLRDPSAAVHIHTFVDAVLSAHEIAPLPPLTEREPPPESGVQKYLAPVWEDIKADIEAHESRKRDL